MKQIILVAFVFAVLSASPCQCDDSHLRNRQLPSDTENELDSNGDVIYDPISNQTIDKSQRVLLLVGPHKTSSSSVQSNILRWIFLEGHEHIFPNWSWPIPEKFGGEEFNSCGHNLRQRPKMFYAYIGTLNGMGGDKCLRKAYKSIGSKKEFIGEYEREFYKEWKEGKSLVIASEAMDFVSSLKTDGSKLLDNILKGMPWSRHNAMGNQLHGNNDDITVVVKYRTPRVKHLISLWHQCCMEDMNFYDFLTVYLPDEVDHLRSLDSLRLAEAFLDRNLKVILIDMEGVTEQGYDISDVIACDVMGALCTREKKIVGEIAPPIIANVKVNSEDDLVVSEDQLSMMEKAIRNYDCNFQNMIGRGNLTVLYASELINILDNCKNIPEAERITSRHQLGGILSEIAYKHVHDYYDDYDDEEKNSM